MKYIEPVMLRELQRNRRSHAFDGMLFWQVKPRCAVLEISDSCLGPDGLLGSHLVGQHGNSWAISNIFLLHVFQYTGTPIQRAPVQRYIQYNAVFSWTPKDFQKFFKGSADIKNSSVSDRSGLTSCDILLYCPTSHPKSHL